MDGGYVREVGRRGHSRHATVPEPGGGALLGLVPRRDADHGDEAVCQGVEHDGGETGRRAATTGEHEALSWHGNVVQVLEKIEETRGFLDGEEIGGDNVPKLRKALDEFDTYLEAN